MSSMFVKNKSVPASDRGRLVYAFSLQLAISFLKNRKNHQHDNKISTISAIRSAVWQSTRLSTLGITTYSPYLMVSIKISIKKRYSCEGTSDRELQTLL
jgi:hypothetical protein